MNASPLTSAEEVREKRLGLGLSQEELARELGVSIATVSRLEKRGTGLRISAKTRRALDKLTVMAAEQGDPLAIPTSEFIRSAELVKQAPPHYVNRESQLQVALWAAATVIGEHHPMFTFLFGFPGTGKTTFVQAVAHDLNQQGLPFSVLTVRCFYLAAHHEPRIVRRLLWKISNIAVDPKNHPLMLVLDEIDMLAANGEPPDSRNTLAFWTMSLLRQLRDAHLPVLVVGVANDPASMDPKASSELALPIYLEPLRESTLAAILSSHGVSNPPHVAHAVLERCRSADSVVTIRDVVHALRTVERLAPRHLESPPIEVAELLCTFAPGVPMSEFRRYQEENRARILQARALTALVRERPAGEAARALLGR